jgi:alkyl hydroperoxide reductase subunit D
VSRQAIFDAIRIASIVSGVAQALRTADVLASV